MPGCTAPNCTNSSQKGFKLYHFPTDKERNLIWAQNCRRERGWKPTKHTCVCEAHFDESQFESHRADGLRKLKPNAIPTIFSSITPLRTYNRKSKKEGNIGKESSKHKKEVKVEILETKLETVSEIEENESPKKKGKKGSGSSEKASAISKEPDHTYQKVIVKDEVDPSIQNDKTEEVFINVSVASKQDMSKSSVRRTSKRRICTPSRYGKKVKTSEKPPLQIRQSKRRLRSSGPPNKIDASSTKKSSKVSDRSAEETKEQEGKAESSANLKSNEPEKKQCFICGKAVEKGLSLYTLTNTTKVYMYQKLDKIVTGEMELLIEEEGILCLRCGNLLNYMDRIEVELSMLNKAILNCIRKKYGMGNKSEKESENILPNIEGDQDDVGSLINLADMEVNTSECNKDVEPDKNPPPDDESVVQNEDNSVVKLKSSLVPVPVEEIYCVLCKFKTSYKSVMIYHLRRHLKDGFQCDFCNVTLPPEELFGCSLTNNQSLDKNPDNTVATNEQEKEANINIHDNSANAIDLHMENNSDVLNDDSELLIAIVPVEDESAVEDDFDGDQERSGEDVEELGDRNNERNPDLSYQFSQSEAELRRNTKQIRILNENGEIVTQEVQTGDKEDVETNRISVNDTSFPQLSLQTVNADLHSLNVENRVLDLGVSEIVSNVEESRSSFGTKPLRILNEIGVIVSKEHEEL